MQNIDTLRLLLYGWLRKSIKTVHGRFVLMGLLVGLLYLPQWIGYLMPRALSGKVGWFLIFSLLGMAALELWSKRKTFGTLKGVEYMGTPLFSNVSTPDLLC